MTGLSRPNTKAASVTLLAAGVLAAGLLSSALAGCTSPAPSSGPGNASAPSWAPTSTPSGDSGANSPAAGNAPASASVTAHNESTSQLCGTSKLVPVSSAAGLQAALASAHPGETIMLAAGTYAGNFVVTSSGTQSAPITLCGQRNAILNGGDIGNGYTLHLERASWWHLKGFTVTGAQKGVMADSSDHDLIDGLYVHSTGDEGIHLRDNSSHDTISNCIVRDTGLLEPFYGEGIYVGSANKNWCLYSGCGPDRSDDDVIEGNNIADTTAENIDIKEGTTGGQITGNQFNGTGMVESAATGWVNVKGNDWLITDNVGVNSVKNGFQVHQVLSGWGLDNTFRGNKAVVNGPGYGFYVQNKRLGTTVSCQNTVSNAGSGFSSVSCA